MIIKSKVCLTFVMSSILSLLLIFLGCVNTIGSDAVGYALAQGVNDNADRVIRINICIWSIPI